MTKRSGRRMFLLIAAVVLIFILVVCILAIVGNWNQMSSSERVSTAVTAAGVTGTLLLAVATVETIMQNSRLIEFREREYKEPIVEHEIENFLSPAIEILDSNIKYVDNEKQIDWIHYKPKYNNIRFIATDETGDPYPLSSLITPFVVSQISQDQPDLWDDINKHDEFIEEFVNEAEKLSNTLDQPVRDLVDELGLESTFTDDSDYRVLKEAMIKRIDEYGENHSHYEAWNAHRSEFLDVLDSQAEENMEKIHQLERRYQNHCEELLQDLQERKIQLQEEYGIVVDQAGEDVDTTTAF